jgi:hypothetical protein
MISKVSFYCNQCQKLIEIEFPFPVNDIKDIKKKCDQCQTYSKNEFIYEERNAVTVELEDIENFNQMDRLPVYLFDENTENIVVNETVKITRRMKVDSDGKKKYTCLYADSIKYVLKVQL